MASTAHRRINTEILQSPPQFRFHPSDIFFDSPRNLSPTGANETTTKFLTRCQSQPQMVGLLQNQSYTEIPPAFPSLLRGSPPKHEKESHQTLFFDSPTENATNFQNKNTIDISETQKFATTCGDTNESPLTESSSREFLKAGSMKSSIFNLTSATLGAGALTIPFAFHTAGLLYSLSTLAVMGIISTVATLYIVQVMIRTELKTFEELSLVAFGHRFAVAVELAIITFCFGTATGYLMTVGDIVMVTMRSLGIPNLIQSGIHGMKHAALTGDVPQAGLTDYDPDFGLGYSIKLLGLQFAEFLIQREVILVLVTVFLLLPLSLADGLNKLRITCVLGVAAIVFLSSVMVARVFILGADIESMFQALLPEKAISDTSKGGTWSSLIRATSLLVFAFSCQTNVPTIYTELERRDARRMTKVSVRALLLCASVYAMIGVGGALSFGAQTSQSIISNLEGDLSIAINAVNQPEDPEISDVPPKLHIIMHALVALGFVGLIPAILFAYPLNIFPCRFAIEALILHYWRPAGAHEDASMGESSEGHYEGHETSGDLKGHKENGTYDDQASFKETHFIWFHKSVAAAAVLASLMSAIALRNLDFVFALSGATAGSFSSVICPALLYVKLMPGPISHPKKIGACFMCAAGVAIAIIGTWDCLASQ